MKNRIIPVLKRWLPLLLLNFLATVTTLCLTINNQGRNIIWLPTGVALAILIVLGPRFWLSIALGIFPAVLLMSNSIPMALGITFANLINVLFTFFLLKKGNFQLSLKKLSDLFLFLFLGIPGTIPGLAIIMNFHYLQRTILGIDLIKQGLIIWAADIISILVIVPLVLIWREPVKKLNKRLPEAGLLFILLVSVSLWFSYQNINEIVDFYIYFPMLFWAGLRFGRYGTSAAILLVTTIITSLYTFRTFSGNNPTIDILTLQISIVIVFVMALSLALIIYERKQVEEKLKEVNEHLEQLISERTMALTAEISEREKIENALRESEEKYRNIIENSVDGIMLIDEEGYILEWNQSLEKITSICKSVALGKRYNEIIFKTTPEERQPPKPADFYQNYLKEFFQDNNMASKQISRIAFLRPDGEKRIMQLSFFIVEFHNKKMIGSIIQDITEQERFADEIYNYAQRLQVLHGIDHAILESRSLDHLINAILPNLRRLVNAQWVNILTYDKESKETTYLGIDNDSQISDELNTYFNTNIGQIPPKLEKGDFILINDLQSFTELTPFQKNILACGIRSFLSVPLLIKEEFIGAILLGTVRPNAFNHEQVNITQEIANELAIAIQQTSLREQIWDQREELRQLTKKTVNAQEEERRRLSRELHDVAGQALTALKINLELITKDLPAELNSFKQRLVEAIVLTDDTMEQLRIMARGLRPPALDTFGLNFALEDLCREFTRRSKIEVEYRGTDLLSLSEEINITFYRILQESLTNIYKHAQATHIIVELQSENGLICLTIVDNGKGFKKGKNSQGKGIGLLGIKERLEMLEGDLEIKSSSNRGSTLKASIPYN